MSDETADTVARSVTTEGGRSTPLDTKSEYLYEFGLPNVAGWYHRMLDTVAVCRNRNLRTLHRKIRQIIDRQRAEGWDGYDYGHGYLYQDFSDLSLSGRRSTQYRVRELAITEVTKGKRVLDIGCCTGFISHVTAHDAQEVAGIDVNPYYIEICGLVSDFLRLDNTRFYAKDFGQFVPDVRFDVVLSLSNHFTYDGHICGSVTQYFEKCRECIAEDGLLLFESHPPNFEARDRGIDAVVRDIERFFTVEVQKELTIGKELDRNRRLIVARAR